PHALRTAHQHLRTVPSTPRPPTTGHRRRWKRPPQQPPVTLAHLPTSIKAPKTPRSPHQPVGDEPPPTTRTFTGRDGFGEKILLLTMLIHRIGTMTKALGYPTLRPLYLGA